MGKIKESLQNRMDGEKWAHPELAENYNSMNMTGNFVVENVYNFDLPLEQRREIVKQSNETMMKMMGVTEEAPGYVRAVYYQAKGCPEDPEVEVQVVVYRPTEETGKKLPVLFGVPAGGMYNVPVEMSPFFAQADKFHCVVVVPRYTISLEKQYPYQMNQIHAAYCWMEENAKELNINMKKVVLEGTSSGSHLALSFCHRLKRYGIVPRGCIVESAFTDNRPIYLTSEIKGHWDARAQWLMSVQWLGENNVSAFNNPEMFPNYASVEECIGLPPTFIHCDTEEGDSPANKEYTDKLTAAGVYNEMHVWGGTNHSVIQVAAMSGVAGYAQRYASVVDGNISDCFQYDLRREWTKE